MSVLPAAKSRVSQARKVAAKVRADATSRLKYVPLLWRSWSTVWHDSRCRQRFVVHRAARRVADAHDELQSAACGLFALEFLTELTLESPLLGVGVDPDDIAQLQSLMAPTGHRWTGAGTSTGAGAGAGAGAGL